MTFEYVRRWYKVPAKREMPVTVDGKKGRITSGKGSHIMVRFDGVKFSVPCHPTWRVVYHTPEGDKPFGRDSQPTEADA